MKKIFVLSLLTLTLTMFGAHTPATGAPQPRTGIRRVLPWLCCGLHAMPVSTHTESIENTILPPLEKNSIATLELEDTKNTRPLTPQTSDRPILQAALAQRTTEESKIDETTTDHCTKNPELIALIKCLMNQRVSSVELLAQPLERYYSESPFFQETCIQLVPGSTALINSSDEISIRKLQLMRLISPGDCISWHYKTPTTEGIRSYTYRCTKDTSDRPLQHMMASVAAAHDNLCNALHIPITDAIHSEFVAHATTPTQLTMFRTVTTRLEFTNHGEGTIMQWYPTLFEHYCDKPFSIYFTARTSLLIPDHIANYIHTIQAISSTDHRYRLILIFPQNKIDIYTSDATYDEPYDSETFTFPTDKSIWEPHLLNMLTCAHNNPESPLYNQKELWYEMFLVFYPNGNVLVERSNSKKYTFPPHRTCKTRD